MKYILILIFSFLMLHADSESNLKKMIGRMLIVGFDNQIVEYDTQIVKDMQKYDLGGVILFDRFYNDKKRVKNILSPYQLKNLTSNLKYFSKKPLFISIDQEGGKVARLKSEYGFIKIPSAFEISKMSLNKAHQIYKTEAKMLRDSGINMNFAPVVDLALNPKNKVIVGLGRSYGKSSKKVTEFAKAVIEEQKKQNIISVIKHFPGHGSSLGDSHKGFVDVSNTWSKKELEPYKNLIKDKMIDMIMTAHVFNSHLDDKYPATLSYKINTKLLREKMHYNGVIISDDLQMAAISKLYSLKQRVTLAINSGVDILLFGNQLADVSVSKLVNTIYEQVEDGAISIKRIKESNDRIQNLHTKYSIVQKPIIFTQKRKDLTKKYIKRHYGLSVKNIKILPKNIVIHWTAVMGLKESFKRFNPETLLADRKDIAKASNLNVSAHFLVNRDGTIYQLMPDNFMARHVIGLNYSSIGIENVGGKSNKKEDLTEAQLDADVSLIKYLKAKYPSIKNVLGHYEYREYEGSSLWLEKDAKYRTRKVDPGKKFMQEVRAALGE